MDDVVIIGGGVVGLSLAYELARRGRKVRIIERGDVGRESSWAGAGIIPPAPLRDADPPPWRLAGLAAQLHVEWHERLRKETGVDNGYRRCGALYLADDDEARASLDAELDKWRRQGVRHDRVAAERIAELEPALAETARAGRILDAYHLPDEAQVRNPWQVRALESACTQLGVKIVIRAPVEEFVVRGDRIAEVRTSVGAFAAEQFCVTAGAWSGLLVERLGVRLPVKPIRGQIVLLNPERPLVRGIVYAGRDFRHYFVARHDGRILVGSTEEDVGFDTRTTGAVTRDLLDFALRLAPSLGEVPVEQTWAGLRPFAADGLPYLGRVPQLANAFVAAGHYRWGLFLSTATAVVMTQLMHGEPPSVDLPPFRIDR